VRVVTWTHGDNFCLAVEDNGLGIPAAHQEKVFRLFHRLSDRDTAGTGLGLPLVKKNVTRLGGEVQLECKNNTTTFTVILSQIIDGNFLVEEN